jgi:hypothetical protein
VSVNHVVESDGWNTYGMALFTMDSYLTGRTEKMRIAGNGNVGIGTTSPQRSLDIRNSTNYQLRMGNASVYNYDIGRNISDGFLYFYGNQNVANGYVFSGINGEKMRIGYDGNVGIGTTAPDAKLAVNGTIHSKEVKVDMNILPDYVFKPGYDLLTLDEVKRYIDKNQHLPGVPSAEQTEKEGLNLGEMNVVLLKKVEELTLYLLEKDEQLKSDRKDISELKKQVEKLTRQQQK